VVGDSRKREGGIVCVCQRRTGFMWFESNCLVFLKNLEFFKGSSWDSRFKEGRTSNDEMLEFSDGPIIPGNPHH